MRWSFTLGFAAPTGGIATGMRGSNARRLTIAGLSAAGLLDSMYMLSYEQGLIDSLVCPFFGEGCNKVGRSRHARHFGIPNALAGIGGYALMGALALWPSGRKAQRTRAAVLAATALGAATAGGFLTWEQKTKVRAWCFWCLSSTALSFAITSLAVWDGARHWRR